MLERLTARTIVLAILAILLIGSMLFALDQCQKRKSQAAQSRVDAAQGQAYANSAADAIGVVSKAGERETASEELTRSNERDIRSAEGADDKVNPAVKSAGIAALCKRAAYQNDPRCKR